MDGHTLRDALNKHWIFNAEGHIGVVNFNIWSSFVLDIEHY